jgi:hypothetical protein
MGKYFCLFSERELVAYYLKYAPEDGWMNEWIGKGEVGVDDGCEWKALSWKQ